MMISSLCSLVVTPADGQSPGRPGKLGRKDWAAYPMPPKL